MSETKTEKPDPTMQVVGCVGMVLALVPLWLYGGWVTSVVWNWFMVPYFGLRPLSVPLAIALTLVVSRFRPAPEPSTERDNLKSLGSMIGRGVFWPSATLAIAWTLHRWWLPA